MRYSYRLLLALVASVGFLASGCGTPLSQLTKDVNRYPKRLLVGEWNGRFEISDSSGMYDLRQSQRWSDKQTLRSIHKMQEDRHYYHFNKDGTVRFFDPKSRRFINGTWEVNKIEGRTLMLDIRSNVANFRKPATFAGYNTIVFRSGVNAPDYYEYGKVVYYRVKNW